MMPRCGAVDDVDGGAVDIQRAPLVVDGVAEQVEGLSAEKEELDAFMKEFEEASIEENTGLQTKLDAALAGQKAAEQARSDAEADAEAAIEDLGKEHAAAQEASTQKLAEVQEAAAAMTARVLDLEVQLEDALEKVAEHNAITEHITEDKDGGHLVECVFTEQGALGIVFEGSSGADIHVASISAGGAASHLAHLKHGMLLQKVQREDVTQLDYDSALGKVIKASRPLTLHFYDPPTVEVHFEEEP